MTRGTCRHHKAVIPSAAADRPATTAAEDEAPVVRRCQCRGEHHTRAAAIRSAHVKYSQLPLHSSTSQLERELKFYAQFMVAPKFVRACCCDWSDMQLPQMHAVANHIYSPHECIIGGYQQTYSIYRSRTHQDVKAVSIGFDPKVAINAYLGFCT